MSTKPLSLLQICCLLVVLNIFARPDLASADRHCSYGLGVLTVSVADLETTAFESLTAESRSSIASVLREVESDFQACGCMPALRLINDITHEEIRASGQLKKKLESIMIVAKKYCEY